jgi:hypothetical protein
MCARFSRKLQLRARRILDVGIAPEDSTCMKMMYLRHGASLNPRLLFGGTRFPQGKVRNQFHLSSLRPSQEDAAGL